jgi:hypothetical protein
MLGRDCHPAFRIEIDGGRALKHVSPGLGINYR